MQAPPYTVVVRDNNRARVGKVDVFTELDCIARFNDVGNWKLTLPFASPQAEALVTGGSVIIHIGDESGPILMSGRADEYEFHRNDSQPGGGTVWVSGSTDDAVVFDRLAYPDPTAPATEQTEETNDVRTGAAEAVMKAYVDYNAGPNALAARQVPGLTIASGTSLGATVTGNPRFTPLGDLLKELATTGGVGFRTVQVSGGDLEFQVYEPEDRTDTARFGWELGNLAQFEFRKAAPKSTRVVVGGGGEGTARVFREIPDTDAEAAWLRRVEVFRDARDTSETDVLDQRGVEELVENGEQISTRIATVDTPYLRFGVHYNLGDLVTVMTGYTGQVIKDVVREVRIQWAASSGPVITTEVGTSSANSTPRMKAELDRLNKRVAELEAQV